MAATPALPTAPPKPTWDPRKPEPPFPWLRPTIRIRLTLLYGCMFLIAGILLLSIIYLLAAQALHEGSGQAFSVSGSDLSRRIELDGPDDEIKELADTFDDMLERLQRAFTAQQRFVGNASHELRTPLAINRTLLEVHLSDPNAPAELHQLGKTLL